MLQAVLNTDLLQVEKWREAQQLLTYMYASSCIELMSRDGYQLALILDPETSGFAPDLDPSNSCRKNAFKMKSEKLGAVVLSKFSPYIREVNHMKLIRSSQHKVL